MKNAAFVLLLLGALAWPGRTAASLGFPEAVATELGLSEPPGPAPGCKLCHSTDAGGLKTAVTPFGRAVTSAGAVAGNVPSLRAALAGLEATGTDSDGDGQADVAELRDGGDPNRAVDAEGMLIPSAPIELPQTGCGVAKVTPAQGAWAWLALWLLVRLRRR